MKIILRSGAVTAAVGVGLSLAALPVVPAHAAGGTHVRCNDIAGLVKAINKANTSGGRVTLASRCTYTLTAPDNADDGLPEITENVTITGHDTTIRRASGAGQDFRILHVVSGGKLTLNSLTVSGGRLSGGSGGGIANTDGTLKLNRTLVRGNLAATGGGITNTGGRLHLHRSTVERNTASNFGGGILNDGTVTMKGGALLKNRAVTSLGGGLENRDGTASLTSVSVRGNTAVEGGGLRNANGSSLRLVYTTVRGNFAESGGGLSNSASTALLERSLITRNTAVTAGGGIANVAKGRVTLDDTKVVRNTPDNCSPGGSVSGCTNPAGDPTPEISQLPPSADDRKSRK